MLRDSLGGLFRIWELKKEEKEANGEEGWRFEVTHVEGMLAPLGSGLGLERVLPGAGRQRGGQEGLAPALFMGLPQSAAPALTTSTPTDPCLAVSQLWR